MKTKTFKTLITVLLSAAALLLFQEAKAGDSGTLTGTPTGVAIATSNSTASASVNLLQAKTVYVWVSANVGSASNTQSGTLTVDLATSPDNSNWSTNGISQVVLVPPDRLGTAGLGGMSTVTAFTSLDLSKAAYFREQQAYNACGGTSQATNYWTNIVVQYFTK